MNCAASQRLGGPGRKGRGPWEDAYRSMSSKKRPPARRRRPATAARATRERSRQGRPSSPPAKSAEALGARNAATQEAREGSKNREIPLTLSRAMALLDFKPRERETTRRSSAEPASGEARGEQEGVLAARERWWCGTRSRREYKWWSNNGTAASSLH